MLESFVFHHIGVAVKSIEETSAMYVAGGYSRSGVTFDPVQSVNICWLNRTGMPLVELLEPVDASSPVNLTLEKNGVAPYHFCYAVDNLDDAVASLRRQRYVLVSKPAAAPAINGSRVAFLFNKNVGLIELVEAPAQIAF